MADSSFLVVPGTSSSKLTMPVKPYDELKGKYAVADYVKSHAKLEPSNVDNLITEPENFQYSTAVWLYEHLRQMCRDIGFLLAELNEECNPKSCPEMRVTDQFHFLCAAHVGTKNCSAIDYSTHTLEGVVSLLNNAQAFPNCTDIENKSIPKFRTILRRLYRILAHAHYHHKSIFTTFESKSFLTLRVHKFALKYSLIAEDQLIIPGFR
jgi:hypothetical protein